MTDRKAQIARLECIVEALERSRPLRPEIVSSKSRHDVALRIATEMLGEARKPADLTVLKSRRAA